MKKIANNRGITLIALIVTIIILIILAGISISMLTGQNGILTRAAEAKEKTEKAQRDEQAQLADLESLIENGGESVYDTTSGANKPALSKGMIPVKWDTSKEKWVICTKNDPEWYNYNESKNQWANVMLCDGTYNESTAVETEVAEKDLGSMFVWIPRFAYKITKGYHDNTEGGMDVKFLIGRTDKTEDGAKIVDYNATYLSMSQYGYSGGIINTSTEKARNNLDIGGTAQHPNNSSWEIYGITGYSAKEGKTKRNQQINTTWASKDTVTNTDDSLTSYAWTVVDSGKDSGAGTKSSTTGNIYGIFDMGCGLAEYTAAYVNNLSGTGQGMAFATGTSTYLATAYPSKSTTNVDFNSAYKAREFCSIYGDAIWETTKNVGKNEKNVGLAWFEDTQEDDGPSTERFFPRGGSCWWESDYCGLCGVTDNGGHAYGNSGFRSALVVE